MISRELKSTSCHVMDFFLSEKTNFTKIVHKTEIIHIYFLDNERRQNSLFYL